MIEFAIMDSIDVAAGGIRPSSVLVDPAPYQVDELRRQCERWNANLVLKGADAAILRERPVVDLSRDEYDVVAAWEHGAYDGARPDKDKHYVVVSRVVGAWEAVATT